MSLDDELRSVKQRWDELQAEIARPSFARLPFAKREAMHREAEGLASRMFVLRERIAACTKTAL